MGPGSDRKCFIHPLMNRGGSYPKAGVRQKQNRRRFKLFYKILGKDKVKFLFVLATGDGDGDVLSGRTI
jgi:hypothetical protein